MENQEHEEIEIWVKNNDVLTSIQDKDFIIVKGVRFIRHDLCLKMIVEFHQKHSWRCKLLRLIGFAPPHESKH